MKKDGIYIMLLGLALTIIIAFLYFSKLNEGLMNKFVLTIGTSFHFNWAPMIGILMMAVGEFLLWESQYSKNLKEVWVKFSTKFIRRQSNNRFDLIYLHHFKFNAMRAIRFFVSIFNF